AGGRLGETGPAPPAMGRGRGVRPQRADIRRPPRAARGRAAPRSDGQGTADPRRRLQGPGREWRATPGSRLNLVDEADDAGVVRLDRPLVDHPPPVVVHLRDREATVRVDAVDEADVTVERVPGALEDDHGTGDRDLALGTRPAGVRPPLAGVATPGDGAPRRHVVGALAVREAVSPVARRYLGDVGGGRGD